MLRRDRGASGYAIAVKNPQVRQGVNVTRYRAIDFAAGFSLVIRLLSNEAQGRVLLRRMRFAVAGEIFPITAWI